MPVVDVDGAALHYEVTGSGEPIVFVHGGWVSSRMWAPQVERFATDNRVVTVDVRGHGRTGPTERRRYSVDLFVHDLRAVVERLDLDDPVLCGLSLGGLIAQGYAACYPDEVRGLVLAGTTQTVPPVPMTRLQRLVMTPKPLLHATIRSMGVTAYFESLLAGIRQLEGHRWVALTDPARDYVRAEVDRFDRREYIKVFDALYDYRPIDVSSLTVDALLVHGDHEASSVVRQNREIAAALDADRRTIPRAGHVANLDNPAAFDDALAGFLAG